MIKRLYLITNLTAGAPDDSLLAIQSLLDDTGVVYKTAAIKHPNDVKKLLKNVTAQDYDAVAVHGGDGTVAQVTHELLNKKIPLLILPGGTANAIAQSFGQTSAPEKVLQSVLQGNYKLTQTDMAFLDKKPFVLDFHYGTFAKTITKTPHTLKRHIGAFAYVIQAIKEVNKAKQYTYKLKIDERKIERRASICFIANVSQPQLAGVPVLSNCRSDDGKLDIALFKGTKLLPVLLWYIEKNLFNRGTQKVVETYHAKKIEILDAPTEALFDDVVIRPKLPIVLTIKQAALTIIVPTRKTTKAKLRGLWLFVTTEWFRFRDHWRRVTTGAPYMNFSQITENLFVGGQPGKNGKVLTEWGITALVSMRMRIPKNLPKEMKILHLPTHDHTPVDLKDLQKGIDFINKQIEKGGKVYVHCHLGEGRAASMAIAYLMSQGMWLNEAIDLIKRYRTFVRPNRSQLQRLREFGRLIRRQHE